MTATTVDLRYRTHDVLHSLDRFEPVLITRRGKPIGTIVPWNKPAESMRSKSCLHPFFGCESGAVDSVEREMDVLRGGRIDAL